METKAIYLGFGILVLIIAGMFGYSYLASQNQASLTEEVTIIDEQNQDFYSTISRIDAKHFYDAGEHTVIGTMILPTPCEVLDATATVAESFPEQVMIDVTIVRTDEMCAQVLTQQRFSVTASASEEATFSARLNGRSVELNLVPASEGETPDTVEFFDKG